MKIELANRMKALPPYVLGKLKTLIYERRKAGHDVIDLNMGNPTDPPPPQVVEKLQDAAEKTVNSRYSSGPGIYNLRREFAAKFKRKFGVTLDPDTETIATIGSKEGFSHMCLAVLQPGDTIVVGDPAFQIHVYGPILAGASVVSVPLGNDDAFLDRIERVLESFTPKPKAFLLNYPHNPTGITIDSLKFFDRAIRIAAKHQVMIMHDFAYGETCFDGYKAPSFLQADGAKEYGVEFSTMSKPYNMAGWRIGFCAGNKDMIKALATIKGYYDYGIFQSIQIAAIVAMREGDQFVAEQAQKYAQRRDVMIRLMRENLGWDVPQTRASMFVWANIPKHILAPYGGKVADFCMDMVEKAEVAMTPGSAFGEGGEGSVRLALVENEQRIRQAVRQLAKVLVKPNVLETAGAAV